MLADTSLPIWVGLDASTKKDSTAIAACSYDSAAKKVRMVMHKIFQPTPSDPINFALIEKTLLDLHAHFDIREVRFDPYQLAGLSQRMSRLGLPMIEYSQTPGNLTEASSNLYELIKGRNLVAYPDDQVRLAISRAVAVETSRGWKISKEKQSHKIDVVVALAMAALGAVEQRGATKMEAFNFFTGERVSLVAGRPAEIDLPNYDVGFQTPSGDPIKTVERS